jgi:hypothetical protein
VNKEARAMRKMALMVLTVIAAAGCERDLPFESTVDQPIAGYRVEGYVTDRLGVPVKNVRIALWYDFDSIDDTTPPSRGLFVDDAAKSVTLRVLDIRNRVVRVLFSGRAPVGELDYPWNNTDSAGKQVPSGVYKMEFRLGGVLRNSYIIIVNGAVSAVTDSLGHYVIPDDNLPVDFSPAPLYSSDGKRFVGNYQITPYIVLDFNLDFLRRTTLTLKKDEITRFDLRI